MARRAAIGAVLAGAVLLLTACTAAVPAHPSTTPTASPTPTLAASACTWTGMRQPLDAGSLGRFAVALTNTSSGTCVLEGTPTATLTGGRRGDEAVTQGSAAGLPTGRVVVPAGATAYAPVSLATTTDGGIDEHCSDSGHTTLQLTPPGATTAVAIDVRLLHPCTPIAGFGWAVYPIQAAMPSAASF